MSKDLALRALEQHNDVYADIIQLIVKNRLQIKPGELRNMERSSSFINDERRLTSQTRDLLKLCKLAKNQSILVGIENQSRIDYSMVLRVLGYDGISYKTQQRRYLKTRHHSNKPIASPVLTIILYTGTDRKWNSHTHLSDCVNIHPAFKPNIHNTRISVINLAWLSTKTIRSLQSDLRHVAQMLRQLRLKGKYKPQKTDKIKHWVDFLLVMKAFVKDGRISDFIKQKPKSRKELYMCEFLDYIEKRGEKKGEIKGKKAGLKEGKKAGLKEGAKTKTDEISVIFNYLQSIGRVETLGDILKSTRKFNATLKKAQIVFSAES